MAFTKDGFKKWIAAGAPGDDAYALLANGGHKKITDWLTDLSSNTTNAVSITVGGTTKSIAASTMKTSLGLGSMAYASTSSYLPLTGGTLTGNLYTTDRHICINHSTTNWGSYYFKNTRTANSGGRADEALICVTNDGNTLWHLGHYGSGTTDKFLYLGYGTYDSAINLQITPEGAVSVRSLSVAQQITRAGQSVAWVNGRSGAILRETSVAGYHTLWSLKTTNGSWDFGEYSTSGYYNIPLLTYITDANFSAGNNSTTYQIKFPLDSGTVALTKNIPSLPSSLKNPYALTIFGVSYDGSAAKTVDKTTFISTLEEGTSTVTDGTMFVTSYASNNGFADTNAVNYPYKRKASCLYDYIYNKHPFTGTTFYSGNSGNAEHNANNIVKNGHYYYTSNGPATSIGATTNEGALYAQSYSDSWVGQIAQDYRNGRLFFRGKNNGTWTDWLTNIDSGNIGNQYVAGASYAYKLTYLFSFANGSSYNKYVLLGTVDVNSAWNGFHGIYQFTGAELAWSGIIYIGFRVGSTIDIWSGVNLFWLSLTDTTWKDCVFLTKETVTVNSVSTARLRVYIKVPLTYHYTKVGAIYLDSAITHGTGAILDSYEGALVSSSTFYTTAQIAESGNLYFTNQRAIDACSSVYFKNRGLYGSIASSIPAKSELTTANGLCGSYKVHYTGASGQLVQFYDGVGGSTSYLQLYTTYNSGLYWRQSTDANLAKDWRLFLDTTNYSSYALPLTGGTLTGTNNVLNVNSTGTNSWIYFQLNNTNKASSGYYSNLAFIANEATYARIGVNDSGIPQYWSNTSSSTAKTLWHAGNSNLSTVDWNCKSLTAADSIVGGSLWLGGNTSYAYYNNGKVGYYTEATSTTFSVCTHNASNGYVSTRLQVHASGVLWINDGVTVTGSIQASQSITADGNMYATHFYESSDIRLKNVEHYLEIPVEKLASLPIFDFTWKNKNKSLNSGTSAQAVQQVLPNLVSGEEELSVNYGALGAITGITACRELVKHADEIQELKNKVELLEAKLKEYESKS